MLTDTRSAALKPRDIAYVVTDSDGLELVIHPTGKKVWRLRVQRGGKRVKRTLGAFPAMKLRQARQERDKALDRIDAGDALASQNVTVAEAAALWLTAYIDRRHKNPEAIRQKIRKNVIPNIGSHQLRRLRPQHVRDMMDQIDGPVASRRARQLLRQMIRWAQGEGLVEQNAADVVPQSYREAPSAKYTVASVESIRACLLAADRLGPTGRVLRYVALTACRKMEALGLRWDEVGADVIEIAPGRMKGAAAHRIPITAALRTLLVENDSDYVFESRVMPRRPMARMTLNRELARQGAAFTVHDLRRSAASHLVDLGFDVDLIQQQLAHRRVGVAGVYLRGDRLEDRRAMLDKWAELLLG